MLLHTANVCAFYTGKGVLLTKSEPLGGGGRPPPHVWIRHCLLRLIGCSMWRSSSYTAGLRVRRSGGSKRARSELATSRYVLRLASPAAGDFWEQRTACHVHQRQHGSKVRLFGVLLHRSVGRLVVVISIVIFETYIDSGADKFRGTGGTVSWRTANNKLTKLLS